MNYIALPRSVGLLMPIFLSPLCESLWGFHVFSAPKTSLSPLCSRVPEWDWVVEVVAFMTSPWTFAHWMSLLLDFFFFKLGHEGCRRELSWKNEGKVCRVLRKTVLCSHSGQFSLLLQVSSQPHWSWVSDHWIYRKFLWTSDTLNRSCYARISNMNATNSFLFSFVASPKATSFIVIMDGHFYLPYLLS